MSLPEYNSEDQHTDDLYNDLDDKSIAEEDIPPARKGAAVIARNVATSNNMDAAMSSPNEESAQFSSSSLSTINDNKLNSSSTNIESTFLSPDSVRLEEENRTAQTQLLEKTIEELRRENTNMKRNISTLYRSAKTELARKDREITSLEAEIRQ